MTKGVLYPCPIKGCDYRIDIKDIQKFSKTDITKRYYKFILDDFLETKDDSLHCPAPECDYIIKGQNGKKIRTMQYNLKCMCGKYFCSL